MWEPGAEGKQENFVPSLLVLDMMSVPWVFQSIDKCVVTHLDNIVVDILMTLHENQASVDRFTRWVMIY